jgi:AcrR family transcriptional regulator
VGRREDILKAASHLFATEGFDAVGIDEVGALAGVTGPAIYYYFPGKTGLLAELLLPTSRDLSENARSISIAAASPTIALSKLIDAHLTFVEDHPQLAIIHGRELHKMDSDDQQEVRAFMRDYVATWVSVIRAANPDLATESARTLAHGVFAMINGIQLADGDEHKSRLDTIREMTYGLLASLVPAILDESSSTADL